MLLQILLCAAVASSAFGNYSVDYFMDTLLDDVAIQVIQKSFSSPKITPFNLKINSTGMFNHKMDATFVKGFLIGLQQLRRNGSCISEPYGSDTRIRCFVSVAPLHFALDADVKGDQINRKTHRISTSTTMARNNILLIELNGRRGTSFANIHLQLYELTMQTSVTQGKLNLNAVRYKNFVTQLHSVLASQLSSILEVYKSFLYEALKRRRLP